jgi:leucyl-tRNA synthetase
MICRNSYVCDRCHHIVSDDPTVTEPCKCDVGLDLKTRIEKGLEATPRLEKMSKSKGNVVQFDDVIQKYGADTLRMYTLAIGPPEKDAEWQEGGIVGYYRFLNRLWDKVTEHEADYNHLPRRAVRREELSGQARHIFQLTHATIQRVTRDIEGRWHFNTAIAAVMELFNQLSDLELQESYVGTETEEELRQFDVFRFATESMALLLAPFVPHICEELWHRMGNPPSLFQQGWPEWDEAAARAEQVEIPVQVNGKVRGRLRVPRDEEEDVVREQALSLETVRRYTDGKRVVSIVVVPNRIVNVVVE